MSQFIPLEQAITMTSLYRDEKENILAEEYRGKNILARCESFERSQFDQVLQQVGCMGIRIYYGMDTNLRVHAIIVGVNNNNEDMLPSVGPESRMEGDGGKIIEEGARCPEECPPTSGLNP